MSPCQGGSLSGIVSRRAHLLPCASQCFAERRPEPPQSRFRKPHRPSEAARQHRRCRAVPCPEVSAGFSRSRKSPPAPVPFPAVWIGVNAFHISVFPARKDCFPLCAFVPARASCPAPEQSVPVPRSGWNFFFHFPSVPAQADALGTAPNGFPYNFFPFAAVYFWLQIARA